MGIEDDFKKNADAITQPPAPPQPPERQDDGGPRPTPDGTKNRDTPYPHPA